MKYLSLLLIVMLALLSSCDRYEHAYTAPVITDFGAILEANLFTPMQTAFNQSTASDVSSAMVYYADDYLNFGVSKSEWEQDLLTMLAGVANPIFVVSLSAVNQLNDTIAQANWRLIISNPANKSVIADSSFVGERLEKINGNWLLKGNQMTCEPPVSKQLVIAEYFTYRTCTNCPHAENKLKELQLQYPHNFIYLEHHTSGGLELAGETTAAYYGAYSPPVTVFNGKEKVTQSNAASLAQYQSLVDAYVQQDTPIRYQLSSTPTVNGRDLSGSVLLTPLLTLDQSNVVLNYVIIEEVSPYSNVSTPDVFLHNVVRAKGSISLNGVNLANPISFNLTSTVDLPEDIRLVIFAQQKPATFQNDATILGGIDIPLNRKGAK
ncbi:MAG: hypothetical protein PHY48_11290 [Candidatus Cloacimonetes bacterium]|nr:hypothetical protein [Candidatus Cloacimonadota bacterium]